MKNKTFKHGLTNTVEYNAWQHMMHRCKDPADPKYKYCGGRGITVCARWHDPINFVEDMGPRPEGLTLGRIDNNGNYELGNCVWMSYAEQNRNRRPMACGLNKQRWFWAWRKDSTEQYLGNNQREFAREHNLVPSSISCCLHKQMKSHRGWYFLPIGRM